MQNRRLMEKSEDGLWRNRTRRIRRPLAKSLNWVRLELTINPAGSYGGDDGARTRDLCRDRAAL
jgi:hypothetical protein